jgi:hypothetical protein
MESILPGFGRGGSDQSTIEATSRRRLCRLRIPDDFWGGMPRSMSGEYAEFSGRLCGPKILICIVSYSAEFVPPFIF